jgi:hypothetical protein
MTSLVEELGARRSLPAKVARTALPASTLRVTESEVVVRVTVRRGVHPRILFTSMTINCPSMFADAMILILGLGAAARAAMRSDVMFLRVMTRVSVKSSVFPAESRTPPRLARRTLPVGMLLEGVHVNLRRFALRVTFPSMERPA